MKGKSRDGERTSKASWPLGGVETEEGKPTTIHLLEKGQYTVKTCGSIHIV